MRTLLLLPTTLALAVGLSAAAAAQVADGPAPAERGHAPKAATAPFEHIDGRLAYVRAELAITEAQQPRWDSFAATVRDTVTASRARVVALTAHGLPAAAPERARLQLDVLAARLDAARQVLEAGTRLYAELSPEQRKAADRLLASPAARLLP